jgi:MMP 1-O-methyltransferase
MNKYSELPEFASAIKGFLSDTEGKKLFALALEASLSGPCLEIGSYCGKSAVYIGTACKMRESTLFTIDHHTGSEEQQPGQLYFDPEIYDEKRKCIDSFPYLKETLMRSSLLDTVVPMVTRSVVAARNWSTPLSLIFIDGGHTYEAAWTDYNSWAPHLIAGGYLLFHDIFSDPSKGGQAPYEVYKKALASNQYDELPMYESLGILKRNTVMIQK